MITSVTLNFPMSTGLHLSDRNRADLDWKAGKFTWRYRSKVTLDRTFSIYSYHLIPYVAAKPHYTSQYSKWSTTALFAGCLFPVGKHVQFNSYLSGVMTFIINQNGIVYQKDLGERTSELAGAITEYNPDSTWKRVTD